MLVEGRVVSLISHKLALQKVDIDHLTVHLIIYPDGSTNQPSPRAGERGAELPGQRLFDLAINEIEVKNGTLLLNQERIPFEIKGENLAAGLSYSRKEAGYEGDIAVSLLSARWRGLAPQRGDVALHLLLRDNQAEIQSLKVATGRSTVEASGTLSNYNSPALDLRYTATLDLAEVGRLEELQELRAGTSQISGSVHYASGDYSSKGSLSFHNLEWKEDTVHAAAIEGSFLFSLTPVRLSFTRLDASLLGGRLRGDVQITNWSRTRRAQQKGTADLQITGLQVAKLTEVVASRRVPIDRLDLAGSASGELTAGWTGSPRQAIAKIRVEVDPPQYLAPQQVPLTAQLRATYNGESRTLDVAALNAATRAIRLDATGKLGSETAQARISVNSTDLHELRPFLTAMGPSTRIPVLLEGRASFNGAVSGKLDALSTSGRLELENFDSELAPLRLDYTGAASSQTAGLDRFQRIHWDSLLADLTYSPSLISFQHGALHRGQAAVEFSASATLRRGILDVEQQPHHSGCPCERRERGEPADAQRNEVSDIRHGKRRSSCRWSAGESARQRQPADHKHGLLWQPFELFRSRVQFAGSNVEFTNILLTHNGAQLKGSYATNLADHSFRFDLTGTSIELASLRRFDLARLTVEGKLAFHLAGSGTAEAPVLNGNAGIHNLVLNHELLGGIEMTAKTRGEDLVLEGRSTFKNADLNMDGDIRLHGDLPGQMKLNFSHLDFDPLLRAYFKGEITGHSSIAGAIDIHGPFRRPRDLVITGLANQLSAELENVKAGRMMARSVSPWMLRLPICNSST